MLDDGYRVGLYASGTSIADAVVAATAAEAARGYTLTPGSAKRLTSYMLPLADGSRDVVAVLGTVAISFQVTGPGIS